MCNLQTEVKALRKIIGIAVGGMAGAMLRYWIRSVDVSGIPWRTFAVNVSVRCCLASYWGSVCCPMRR